ncbi:MAG: hypothetical protein OXS47_04355 [Chloroflexota bacterium]|nr:hypothetical protein [Chloroflexota bacterium]
MRRSPSSSTVTSKKSTWGLVARAVHQRHEDLGPLPTPLAQVAPHQRHPDLVALLTELAVQPRRRQPLLRRRPLGPLGQQLVKARPHPLERRTATHPLPRYRLRLRQVAPDRVTTDAQFPGDRPLALALDQDLVTQDVHLSHPEYSLLQPSRGPRRWRCWTLTGGGSLLER